MTTTPTTILLWRQWRETAIALRMAFAVNAVMALTIIPVQLSGSWISAEDLHDMMQYAWALSLFCALIAILLSHSESRRLSTAFSPDLFRIPIATIRLALLIVGYRASALVTLISATALCIAALTWFPDAASAHAERVRWAGEWMTAELYGRFLLSTLSAYSAFQAIEWTCRRVSHTLAWLAILFPPLILNTVVDEYWRGHPAVHVGTVLVGLPIALAAVWGERLGVWERFQLAATDSGSGGQRRPFRSPMEAQRWFEYRRAGCWLQRSALAGVALAAGLTVYFVASHESTLKTSPVEGYHDVALVYVLLSTLLAGIAAAILRYRDKQTGVAVLSFTMPISTLRLAGAGFAMTARSALVIVVMVLVGTALISVALPLVFKSDGAPLPITAVTAHCLLLLVSVWSLYQFGLGLLASFGLLFIPMMALFAFVEEETLQVILAAGFPVAIALLIAGCVYFLYRHGVATRTYLTLSAAAVPLSAAITLVMLTVDHSGRTPIAYSPSVWTAYFIGAIAPLAFVPAYLTWLRTR